MFIAISGMTGTGKSTIASLVASELGIEPFLENLEEIPAYSAWLKNGGSPYQAQLEFLGRAFRLQKEACTRGGVQERTIYENYEVSVRFYFEKGMLSRRGFDLLTSIYAKMRQRVCHPQLLFHLSGSVETLLERLARRRRLGDANINIAQLHELSQYYEVMLSAWRLCPIIRIDTSALSVHQVADEIVKKVRKHGSA